MSFFYYIFTFEIQKKKKKLQTKAVWFPITTVILGIIVWLYVHVIASFVGALQQCRAIYLNRNQKTKQTFSFKKSKKNLFFISLFLLRRTCSSCSSYLIQFCFVFFFLNFFFFCFLLCLTSIGKKKVENLFIYKNQIMLFFLRQCYMYFYV